MANKLPSVVQSGTNNYLTPSLSFNRIATDLVGVGVIGAIGTGGSGSTTYSGSFAVNQQGSPNMTVAVSSGQAYVSATPTGGTAQTFGVTMDASENVTISANSSGSTRYSFIYIKLDPDKLNNPASTGLDVATFVEQVSTTQGVDSNGAPTNSLLLAEVTVANNATSISAANITDRRTNATPLVTGGWQAANETWTYVSATTFTVPSDVTNKYSVGDKLRLRQSGGTYKHFYVVGVGAFSGSTTTITVTGGADYSLANATIYEPYYSKKLSPQGFPQWFNYTETWGGFSVNPTGGGVRFAIIGRTVFYNLNRLTSGTSNSTNTTVTLPVTSASTGFQTDLGGFYGIDNGSANGGVAAIASGVSSISLFYQASGLGWTASGAKNFRGLITYEI